jgi:hypothetical protein
MADDFHDQVITDLAELRTMTQMVIDRLNKINGSISTLHTRVNVAEKDLANHAAQCPLRSDVVTIREDLSALKVKSSLLGAISGAMAATAAWFLGGKS